MEVDNGVLWDQISCASDGLERTQQAAEGLFSARDVTAVCRRSPRVTRWSTLDVERAT